MGSAAFSRHFIGCALAAAASLAAGAVEARGFSVLYAFKGGADGNDPESAMITDASGNLYGTTYRGGGSDCGGYGCGTVFKLAPDGTETVLYAFASNSCTPPSTPLYPAGPLTIDGQGNLYGTTYFGGQFCGGSVFKLAPDRTETVLYSFTGNNGDGAGPLSGAIRDKAGNFYGTTVWGGANFAGAVFKISPAGNEAVLHSFSPFTDGDSPYGGLVEDKNGNLYGTTSGELSFISTVFRIAPDGTETVLHSFSGYPNDGGNAYAGVIRDSAGILYGTTYNGGAHGDGAVFQLSPGGEEALLYSFDANNSDGFSTKAGLVRDGKGNLFGTTPDGGQYGGGTVFKIAPDGTETILHSFSVSKGPVWPSAALTKGGNRTLYGTTCCGGRYKSGTVFEIKN